MFRNAIAKKWFQCPDFETYKDYKDHRNTERASIMWHGPRAVQNSHHKCGL
jgi:hypothetical protein